MELTPYCSSNFGRRSREMTPVVQPLTSDFEDLAAFFCSFLEADHSMKELLLEHISESSKIAEEKLALQLQEKHRLEVELAQVEKKRAASNAQMEEFRRTRRRERTQTKLAEKKRYQVKEALNVYLELLPTNYRREMEAKISVFQPRISSSSSSNLEVELTTDSARSASYVTSVSPPTEADLTDWSELEEAFDKRVSSSTGSECSSLQLFAHMLELLKRRPHFFHDRCFMMGNKCYVCDKKLVCGRKEFECRECGASVHRRCQDQLALPCIPARRLNLRKVKAPAVAAFCCAGFRPQIPAFVVHSVLTVEERGLREERLYVLPDYSTETAVLKQRLENDGFVPNLNRWRTSTVCELLKHFLSECASPLIDYVLYEALENFVAGGNKNDHADLAAFHDAMLKGSEAERATLCMLMLHLKKVCESFECKVSAKSLAKTFAPILVRGFNTQAAFNDKKQKYELVQNLLKLPSSLYECTLKELF